MSKLLSPPPPRKKNGLIGINGEKPNGEYIGIIGIIGVETDVLYPELYPVLDPNRAVLERE